jgi:hypothetical protein
MYQNCTLVHSKKQCNESLVGFSARVEIPLIKPDATVSFYQDTTNIYYFDKYVFFQVAIDVDTIIDNKLLPLGVNKAYFLFDTLCSKGIFYSAQTPGDYKLKNVDSFVNLKLTRLVSIDSSLHIKTTQTTLTSGEIIKFVEVKSGNGNKIDSVKLLFKKFNERFSYSISPNYENVDQLKLVKYNLILNLPPAENNPPGLKFKSSVELSELGEFGPETSIFGMFEKLKKVYSSLKCN